MTQRAPGPRFFGWVWARAQQQRLELKLLVPAALVGAIAIGASVAFYDLNLNQEVDRQYLDQARAAAGSVSYSVAVDSNNPGDVVSFTSSVVKNDAGVAGVSVWTNLLNDPIPWAESAGFRFSRQLSQSQLTAVLHGQSATAQKSFSGVRYLEYLTPIELPNGDKGAIDVYVSQAGRGAALRDHTISGLATGAVSLIGALVLLWTMLSLLILRRIRPMARVAAMLARNDLDVENLAPKGKPGRDELGIVAIQIDNMVAALRRRAVQNRVRSELGLAAASAESMASLIDHAGRVIPDALDGCRIAVTKVQTGATPAGKEVAGQHGDGTNTHFAQKPGQEFMTNFILEGLQPVIYQQSVVENRFDTSCLQQLGIKSSVGIAIPGRTEPQRVLNVYSIEPREFSADDISFIHSIADLFGAAAARLEAEASRQETEVHLRDTFETSPSGIIFVDQPTGRVLDSNPAYCAMLGYTVDELTAMTVFDLTHPDDVETTRAGIAKLAEARPGSMARFSNRFVTKAGETVWADMASTLVRNRSGMPLHIQTTAVDITERKVAESTLRSTLGLLKHTGEDRQRLMAQLVRAQQEQRRTASALHDHVAQVMIGAGVELARIGQEIQDPAASRKLAATQDVVARAADKVRVLTDRRRGGSTSPLTKVGR